MILTATSDLQDVVAVTTGTAQPGDYVLDGDRVLAVVDHVIHGNGMVAIWTVLEVPTHKPWCWHSMPTGLATLPVPKKLLEVLNVAGWDSLTDRLEVVRPI